MTTAAYEDLSIFSFLDSSHLGISRPIGTYPVPCQPEKPSLGGHTCVFLVTRKSAVVSWLRRLAGVWLAPCSAGQRPAALVRETGSGPVHRVRGLRSGRARAAPSVCRRPVRVARGTAPAHTYRLFLIQEVASVPTSQGQLKVVAREELHLCKQAGSVCGAGSCEAAWVRNPRELAASSPAAREGWPAEGFSWCAQDLWARDGHVRIGPEDVAS